MGCFDSVWFSCPGCGARIEFQSKADRCLLRDYPPAAVPGPVAADIEGTRERCPGCKRSWRAVALSPIRTVPMALAEDDGTTNREEDA